MHYLVLGLTQRCRRWILRRGAITVSIQYIFPFESASRSAMRPFGAYRR